MIPMTNNMPALAFFAALAAVVFTGCSDSGSDAPAPAPWTYEMKVSDDSQLASGVEPRDYQPLTSMYTDVVVTNQTTSTAMAPLLSLNILDANGRDITPSVPSIAADVPTNPRKSQLVVRPPDLAPGESYQWRGYWNQQDALYSQVVPGTYTLNVVKTGDDGKANQQTVASRKVVIRKSLSYTLATSPTDTRIPGYEADNVTEFDLAQKVFLKCVVTNNGNRPLYRGVDEFAVFDEQTGRTIRVPQPVFAPAVDHLIYWPWQGLPVEPGETSAWYDTWNQDGYLEPLYPTSSQFAIERFIPAPGWYRIDVTRWGVVLASRRIKVRDPGPLMMVGNG